jgi:hypothetical protein
MLMGSVLNPSCIAAVLLMGAMERDACNQPTPLLYVTFATQFSSLGNDSVTA